MLNAKGGNGTFEDAGHFRTLRDVNVQFRTRLDTE
jgi:hypothetical protein